MLVGGGSDVQEKASSMMLPIALVEESENYRHSCNGIYPDNIRSVSIFIDLITQWRVGASGAIGLDYNVLPMVLDLREVKKEERQQVFDDVKIMEMAALNHIREK